MDKALIMLMAHRVDADLAEGDGVAFIQNQGYIYKILEWLNNHPGIKQDENDNYDGPSWYTSENTEDADQLLAWLSVDPSPGNEEDPGVLVVWVERLPMAETFNNPLEIPEPPWKETTY